MTLIVGKLPNETDAEFAERLRRAQHDFIGDSLDWYFDNRQPDIERADCGTGAGGFKPGNTCATGGKKNAHADWQSKKTPDEIAESWEFETHPDDDYEIAYSRFTVGDNRQFAAVFSEEDFGGGSGIYDYSFYDDENSTQITNRGDAMEVIRKSAVKLDEFIKTKKPFAVTMIAHGRSRQKLYRFLAKRVSKLHGDWVGMESTKYDSQFAVVPRENIQTFLESGMEDMVEIE
jgi:hypothetical protein